MDSRASVLIDVSRDDRHSKFNSCRLLFHFRCVNVIGNAERLRARHRYVTRRDEDCREIRPTTQMSSLVIEIIFCPITLPYRRRNPTPSITACVDTTSVSLIDRFEKSL